MSGRGRGRGRGAAASGEPGAAAAGRGRGRGGTAGVKRPREAEPAEAASLAPPVDAAVRDALLSLLAKYPSGLSPAAIDESEIGSKDAIQLAMNSVLADRLAGVFLGKDGKQVLKLVQGEEHLADMTYVRNKTKNCIHSMYVF